MCVLFARIYIYIYGIRGFWYSLWLWKFIWQSLTTTLRFRITAAWHSLKSKITHTYILSRIYVVVYVLIVF